MRGLLLVRNEERKEEFRGQRNVFDPGSTRDFTQRSNRSGTDGKPFHRLPVKRVIFASSHRASATRLAGLSHKGSPVIDGA